MTSSRKAAANRANAQRSTGPRSADGKARSRLNAFKHGLATPVSAVPELIEEFRNLTRMLAGSAADRPDILQAAARVAEAAIDVMRTRRARVELMDRMTRDPAFLAPDIEEEPIPARPARIRFSKAAIVRAYLDGTHRQQREVELAQIVREVEFEAGVKRVRHQRAAAKQSARQRASWWDQLNKLDRYERRALSRRNTAIKALDEAWAAAAYESADQLTSMGRNEPKENGNTQ